MRVHRTLSGLVVASLMGLGPVASATSAHADEARAGESHAVSRTAGDLPRRKVSSRVVEKRNQLILRGEVSPGHARKVVFIQKRDCRQKRCDWYRFATVTSTRRGAYQSPITAPRHGYDYWRARVKGYDGYAASYSRVWRTYTV